MADNMCIFFNYVIRDEIKFENVGSNSILKATFGASSNRPNKNGLWIKHYYVAFGDTAERLRKCNIKAPCFVTLTCEQTVYKDKKDEVRENYIVTDFSLTPKPKTETKETMGNSESESSEMPEPKVSGNTTPNVQPQVSSVSDLHGLDALEKEFI